MSARLRRMLGLATLIALAMTAHAFAQQQQGYRAPEPVRPFFRWDATARPSGHGDTCDVRVDVAGSYDQLVFVKSPSGFAAGYEIDILAQGKHGERQISHTITDTVRVKTYKETSSDSVTFGATINVRMVPGTYELLVNVTDQESRQTARQKATFVAPTFSATAPDLSEPRLLTPRSDWTTLGDSIEPRTNLEHRVRMDVGESLNVEVELYHVPALGCTLVFGTRPVDDSSATLKVLRQFVVNAPGRQRYQLAGDSLEMGKWALVAELRAPGLPKHVSRATTVEVTLSQMGRLLKHYSDAIDELRYVATTAQMDTLKAVPETLRVTRWKAFWKAKDPTPNTPHNEVMEEYYRRLDYAQKHYGWGTSRPGYLTDRGRIYIIYGEPDEIESHPFDSNSNPTEIWFYLELRRRFTFMDRHLSGEYDLLREDRL